MSADPTHAADLTHASRIVLVLGGARSGKSAEAERVVTTLAGSRVITYVATALLDTEDPSLAERVAAHRARRPPTWLTVDAGSNLPAVLRAATGPVLLDSLGPWVAGGYPSPPDAAALVAAITERDGDTVVVSDEVGLAVHPTSESGRWFVDAVGMLNQAVAAVAGEVRLVVAGRVLVLPAVLPATLAVVLPAALAAPEAASASAEPSGDR